MKTKAKLKCWTCDCCIENSGDLIHSSWEGGPNGDDYVFCSEECAEEEMDRQFEFDKKELEYEMECDLSYYGKEESKELRKTYIN